VHEVTIRELSGVAEIRSIYPLYSKGSSLSQALFEERLGVMVAQGNYRCIAAYIGDRMVGVSGFWVGMQLWTGKYCEPDHVIVDAEMRSGGIGAQLMQWIEREAERLGCDLLRVAMILGKDRTRSFYRRNGYADDGLILVKPLSAWADGEFPEYAAHKAAVLLS
jgi:GNAT superfamily N-acetyltransferase